MVAGGAAPSVNFCRGEIAHFVHQVLNCHRIDCLTLGHPLVAGFLPNAVDGAVLVLDAIRVGEAEVEQLLIAEIVEAFLGQVVGGILY